MLPASCLPADSHWPRVQRQRAAASARPMARFVARLLNTGRLPLAAAPHCRRVNMASPASKRVRGDAPDTTEAAAAAAAAIEAAEEDLQCPVCCELPEGIVNQERNGARARRRAGARELTCWGAMAHGREVWLRVHDGARRDGARPRGRAAARACARSGRAGAPEPLVVSAKFQNS